MSAPLLYGSFSKGVPGSVTLNLSTSGAYSADTSFCSPSCSEYQSCYASNTESRKPSVRVNLSRKASALQETLQRILKDPVPKAPWFRLSAFGSIPSPETLAHSDPSSIPTLRKAFSRLGSQLDHNRVHAPVETHDKASFLHSCGWHPRLSLGAASDPISVRQQHLTSGFPVSVIAGDASDKAPGWTKRSKAAARTLQRQLTEIGLTAKTCPAIVGSAKCGKCTLCSGKSGIDVVIYPRHP